MLENKQIISKSQIGFGTIKEFQDENESESKFSEFQRNTELENQIYMELEKILSGHASESDDERCENIYIDETKFDTEDLIIESPRKGIGKEMQIKRNSNPFLEI